MHGQIASKNFLKFFKKVIDTDCVACYNNRANFVCECAGIGRQARLRGVCPRRTGSSPVTRTTSERVTLVPIFYFIKNQSPAPLFLLFRKRSRSHRRTACKRAVFTPICSLPTFCGRARRVESFQILSFHSDHVGAKSALLRLLFCLWQKRSHTPAPLPAHLRCPKPAGAVLIATGFDRGANALLAVSRTARCPNRQKVTLATAIPLETRALRLRHATNLLRVRLRRLWIVRLCYET